MPPLHRKRNRSSVVYPVFEYGLSLNQKVLALQISRMIQLGTSYKLLNTGTHISTLNCTWIFRFDLTFGPVAFFVIPYDFEQLPFLISMLKASWKQGIID
uniref:Uncharacterized protein n=1 Tax=Tetranychus urticae TaxID=32264 RepID=T1K7K7_TETUR